MLRITIHGLVKNLSLNFCIGICVLALTSEIEKWPRNFFDVDTMIPYSNIGNLSSSVYVLYINIGVRFSDNSLQVANTIWGGFLWALYYFNLPSPTATVFNPLFLESDFHIIQYRVILNPTLHINLPWFSFTCQTEI